MKHLKNRAEFKSINESLDDLSAIEVGGDALFEVCISAQSGDLQVFIDDYTEHFGSAAEIWMEEERWLKLADIFKTAKDDDRYKFANISGQSDDGDNSELVEYYLDKGWVIFASEQNGDSYDAILFYHPDASRSQKAIKRYDL